jgi:hypothetical protein
MKLYRYLSRLQSTIYSHREIEIEMMIASPQSSGPI